MFLYYRAVQSIALSYGYDVKNDPSELMIASEVLSFAFSPNGADLGGAAGVVGKIMGLAEVATVGQVIKKGWQAMAERGGACLLIAQMRALAYASARKALEKAGKAGLEKSVFRNILEQVGKRLPQKVVQRGVPVYRWFYRCSVRCRSDAANIVDCRHVLSQAVSGRERASYRRACRAC